MNPLLFTMKYHDNIYYSYYDYTILYTNSLLSMDVEAIYQNLTHNVKGSLFNTVTDFLHFNILNLTWMGGELS